MVDTFDLDLRQGEHYRLGLRYLVSDERVDLSTWSWRAQARQNEARDAELILDLTPLIVLDVDLVTLWLTLTSEITTAIESVARKAAWDLFIWPTGDPSDAILLVQGAVTLDKSATNTFDLEPVGP